MQKYIFLFLFALSLVSCSFKQKIEVQDVQRECDFSIFHGLKPDMKIEDFFAVLGGPNEWFDEKEGDESHCPMYYFDSHKLMGYWDGHYPEIGVIEFIPYINVNYTIDKFLSNPTKYGIDTNTKRFDIYCNGIWWFEVYLDNFRVKRIQFWNIEKRRRKCFDFS